MRPRTIRHGLTCATRRRGETDEKISYRHCPPQHRVLVRRPVSGLLSADASLAQLTPIGRTPSRIRSGSSDCRQRKNPPLRAFSTLNYRCGGSAGFACFSLTGFPFQPVHCAVRGSPSTRQGYAAGAVSVNRQLRMAGPGSGKSRTADSSRRGRRRSTEPSTRSPCRCPRPSRISGRTRPPARSTASAA